MNEGEWQKIILPHDAMIGERRSERSAGGGNIGWFECYDYEYRRTFSYLEEWSEYALTLEFEGVYQNAEVYLNGEKISFRPYGYTNFYCALPSRLLHAGENEVLVVARNSEQPNSRWYTGAGIYRPVWLYLAKKRDFLRNGVRVRTLSHSPARVEITVQTSASGELYFCVYDGEQAVWQGNAHGDGGAASVIAELPQAKLWTAETPHLYQLTVRYGEEEWREKFGVRTLSCSAQTGLLINGERVILRGACIHHDNGLLGARCFEEAEYRKIRLLKQAGYNAVRSAHNPCSKALLRACDELGMYVMDEYADGWYIHKTKYDYATNLPAWYQQDLRDMVEKDFNHPSVVLYSLGNEVAETGQREGIALFEKMRDCVRALDDRPVTAGVNIFFNLLYALGFGVYSDKKAEKAPQKKVGSEFFNALAGKLGGEFMKKMATLPACDNKTKDCFAQMDVAGYNYGIYRYLRDVKRYPNRVIVGSETFCADAYRFYELAKKTPAVIGDFVWAGMDYLGEVGVGSWEYPDYAPLPPPACGWISAGSGRLDLNGVSSGETLYTRVAFELEQKPQIAVRPVHFSGKRHSPSAWKMTDAMPSWSFEGCEGRWAQVEVYTRDYAVALYLNGKKVGQKRRKKDCKVRFRVRYRAGELTAVSFNREGKELSQSSLKTAEEETVLRAVPERERLKRGELCYIPLRFCDRMGEKKPTVRGRISVAVTGGELLALGNACPFQREWERGSCESYYGEALAIVRAGEGEWLTLTATSGALQAVVTVAVVDEKINCLTGKRS